MICRFRNVLKGVQPLNRLFLGCSWGVLGVFLGCSASSSSVQSFRIDGKNIDFPVACQLCNSKFC